MSVADVIIHPSMGSPVHHKKLDCASCIKLILPQVQECRRTKRTLRVVAEVRLRNGTTVKFGSVDGDIEIKEISPLIGGFRTLLGVIPLPSRTENHPESNDFAIHKILLQAYQNAAE
jgi:hypothetical protein